MTSTRVFFENLTHEIIWKFGVIRIQDQAMPITNFMSFEVQFYIDCQNFSWYIMKARHGIYQMITVVSMVEMIGIRNDECPRGACHELEPITGH